MSGTLGRILAVAVTFFLLAPPVQAYIINFSANLFGLQEAP
jgi:hypothetical protein